MCLEHLQNLANSEDEFSVALIGREEVAVSESAVQNSPFCLGREEPWLKGENLPSMSNQNKI